MKVNEPLITIFTLVYNTNHFALKALECVKNQTFKNFEHIIIDDFSTDNSADLVEQWIKENNWPCVYYRNNENKGICNSLNRILKIAKGKYFGGICDDEWNSNHLEEAIKFFEICEENVAIIYSDAKAIDESSKIIENSIYFSKGINDVEELHSKDITQLILDNKHAIITPTVTHRIEALKAIGGFNEDLISEDYDMWLRLSTKYKFNYYPAKTVSYRIRPGSLSRTTSFRPIFDRVKIFNNFLKVAPSNYKNKIKNLIRVFAKSYILQGENYWLRNEAAYKNFIVNPSVESLIIILIAIFNIQKIATKVITLKNN